MGYSRGGGLRRHGRDFTAPWTMSRHPLLLLLATSLLAAIWGFGWLDYRSHTAEHEEQFDKLGAALVGASEAVVLRLCRGGRYDPEELELALGELRTSIGAERLALASLESGELARAGSIDALGGEPTRAFSSRFEPPTPRGRGQRGPGPPDLAALPEGDLLLELELSTAALDSRLAGDMRRFLGLSLALSAALALFLVLHAARERAMALAGDLGQAQEKLRSLEFLRRLGAGLAHETRNPLGVLRGFAQELASGATPPERVPEVANMIVEQTDRTVTRLDEFMLLSRPAQLRRERFDLQELIAELGVLLQPDLDATQASLRVQDFQLEVDADKEQTRRLFMNLLLNGVQALGPGGALEVQFRPEGEHVDVRVVDDGPGVPPDLCETLFEPYASRREGGTGLGLAIVRRIANEHGWRVRHEEIQPHGAAFIVRMPRP